MGNYVQEVSLCHGRSYLTKKLQTAKEFHVAVEILIDSISQLILMNKTYRVICRQLREYELLVNIRFWYL